MFPKTSSFSNDMFELELIIIIQNMVGGLMGEGGTRGRVGRGGI